MSYHRTTTRREFLTTAAVLGAGSLAGCSKLPESSVKATAVAPQDIRRDRYNVVVFSVDSLAKGHLGCWGYPRNTSPNIDELSKQSFIFDRVIGPPWTVPSYTSLFTGQSVPRHGIFWNDIGKGEKIPDSYVLAQDIFRDAGYTTAFFFQLSYLRVLRLDRGFGIVDLDKESRNVRKYDRLIQGLHQLAGQSEPFFLMVYTLDCHYPYLLPEESGFDRMFLFDEFYDENAEHLPLATRTFLEPADAVEPAKTGIEPFLHRRMRSANPEFIRAQYDATIRHVDHQFGRLVQSLGDLDLLERTIIVLTADHGECMTEHGWYFSHHGPWRQITETPLIIRVPGARNERLNGMVKMEDVFPTLFDMIGLSVPSFIKGRSFLPVMTGESSTFREFACTKGIFFGLVQGIVERSGKTHEYKLLLPDKGTSDAHTLDQPYLFDLTQDAEEKNNIHRQHGDVVAFLTAQFNEWERNASKDRNITFEMTPDFEEETYEKLRHLGYL